MGTGRKRETAVPVVLIQDRHASALETRLKESRKIELIDMLSTDASKGMLPPRTCRDILLIVLNVDTVEREAALSTGFRLVDSGHQVFLTTATDFATLVEVLIDTFRFLKRMRDRGCAVQTALMVTAHAGKLLDFDLSRMPSISELTAHQERNGRHN